MSSNLIDDLRRAHEGEYFSKREAELIEKLRQQLKVEAAAEDIERTGLVSHGLATTLAELGIDQATLPLLHLVPLVKVAWASGAVEPEERQLIELAALQAGVKDGSPAWSGLQAMLERPPTPALYGAALAYLSAAAPEADRASILSTARSVAAATGGLFGIFGNVEAAERDALAELAARLEQR
jgi:hypothetical protein